MLNFTDDRYPNQSEGFQIFLRGDVWWVRFSLKQQGQLRFSLKTKDGHAAELLAREKWATCCLLAEHDIRSNSKSFTKVADEFIAQLEREVKRGVRAEYQASQYPNIIRTYFMRYFDKRAIDQIRAGDIERYWDWRREYWISGPGSMHPYIIYKRVIKGRETRIRRAVKEGYPTDSTLAKEVLLFNQIFDFARRQDYLKQVPEIALRKSKVRKQKARPGFTLEEFRHLLDVSERRVHEDHINSHVRNDRTKLHAFCYIAGFTGLRPTEMFNLCWGNIEQRTVELVAGLPQNILVFHVRGKGKERETATMPEILTSLNLLKNVFMLEVGREPDGDDPVFANADGSAIKSFKVGLAQLLDAAELRTVDDGRQRSSFSFRHFYITQQIRNNVNPHVLARNAGTSTQMIDQYYSKIVATDEVSKLTPDWFGTRFQLPVKGR